jgi:hypothetical protein
MDAGCDILQTRELIGEGRRVMNEQREALRADVAGNSLEAQDDQGDILFGLVAFDAVDEKHVWHGILHWWILLKQLTICEF